MALQLDFKTTFGMTIPNAYVRVSEIHHLTKGYAMAVAAAYVDKDQPLDKFIEQTGFEFPYDHTGPNPIAQAYAYLKGKPEFSEALDV